MARWVKRIGVVVLALALIGGGVGLWKREEIARLMAVNSLFAEDKIIHNFSNMNAAFLSVPLSDAAGTDLPVGATTPLPDGAADWIDARAVTALIVLKDGEITHESYHLGTGPDDLRVSWSVAKSFLSLLTGILIDEGVVALTDPVTKHVPALIGTAYDGASLEDVLQMESGAKFNEDYFDPTSDINRMGRVIALGGAIDEFTAEIMDRDREPGAEMKYVSMDTHVIGMVLRGATGRSVPDLMAEKLTGPMGVGPAYFLTDGEGVAFVLGGINMRTRDYARMGQMVLQGGRLDGAQIVPRDWIETSTVPSARTRPGWMQYGYQWWMPSDTRPGELLARGVYGQFVYIDKARGVVIAVNSADRGFRGNGVTERNIDMFRRIAAAQ